MRHIIIILSSSRTNCTKNAVKDEEEEYGQGIHEAGETALFRAPAPESREPGTIMEDSPVLLERGSPSTCE